MRHRFASFARPAIPDPLCPLAYDAAVRPLGCPPPVSERKFVPCLVRVLNDGHHASALADWDAQTSQDWSFRWGKWLFPEVSHPYLCVRLLEQDGSALTFSAAVPASLRELESRLNARFPLLTFEVRKAASFA